MGDHEPAEHATANTVPLTDPAGIDWHDVAAAWNRIASGIAPMYHTDFLDASLTKLPYRVVLAREHEQHTGSFRARGALHFLLARRETVGIPRAGIAIATDQPATAAAWAWAARKTGTPVTMFVSPSVHSATVRELRGDGVTVEVVTTGDMAAVLTGYAQHTGALIPEHDDPLIAAGHGTWVRDIGALVAWELDTVIIPNLDHGADAGLLVGTAAVARHRGIKIVVGAADYVDPVNSALESVAAGKRTLPALAQRLSVELMPVRVSADDLDAAQRSLRRHAITAGSEGATALAAVIASGSELGRSYRPSRGETVAVLLSGADNAPTPRRSE